MPESDIHESHAHLIDEAKITQVAGQMPDESTLIDLTQIFGLLADSTRLKIVVALLTTELCVHEIAVAVNMSVSAVSHQLRLLKAMKLVKFRRQGKMVHYSLVDEHIEQLILIAKEHVSEK